MKHRIYLFTALLSLSLAGFAQRVTDKLDRGLVAIPASSNGGSGSGNFVSWRIFAEEYYNVTYNLYANNQLVKSGLKVSNFNHTAGTSSTKYKVAAVVNGVEQELSAEGQYWANGYKDIPVAKVEDRNGNDVTSQYILNDISLGDVDGDGIVEFLVKRNYTGNINTTANTTCFHHYECYNLKGERLWWIDLGPNMMAGPDEQWDIVLFDWDQDGKAEGIMRGADNMIIHTASGNTINVGNMSNVAPRDQYTCVGNEYLLYINGLTGELYNISGNAEKPWMTYPLPRYESGESDYVAAWGGSSNGGHDGGHRSSKHYFGAPFLDGRHPSIFLGRGCYTRHKMVALDVDPVTHKLTVRWRWANNNGWSDPWFGNGYHNFGIADVDEDGRDEIVFGSMVIDDNGKGLSTTGFGHGDAQHCGDFDPYRKGLEFFACNEDEPNNNYRNATTSKIYFRSKGTADDGRGLMGNFSNSFPGCMGRSVNSGLISSVADKEIAGGPNTGGTNDALYWSHLNFRIYWTGDLIEGILDSPGTEREAVVWTTANGRVFQSSGCQMNNDSKNNPCAQGDIFGDWREEIVLRADGNTKIRIYTTPQPTNYRIPTLWHDHQYRNAMVWQPMGYNQPPHISYFLGQLEGITVAPPPYTMTGRTEIPNGGTISAANAGQHVIVCETNDTQVSVADGANPDVAIFNVPSWVQGTNSNKTDGTAAINYKYYSCTVQGGAFTGRMRLVKQGDGILSLPKVAMTHTGPTDIWAGTLNFDGSMLQSSLWLNRFAELNSAGSFRSIKADYASVIQPGGENALGAITTDSLVLGFGSRLKLDAYSDGLKIDNVNTKYLSIERKTGSVWETYGPNYLMPVIEIVVHSTDGSSQLTPGQYLIGNMTELKGSLENIKIEGIESQKSELVQEDGKLFLVIKGLRDPATVYWTGVNNSTWNYAGVENFQNSDGEAEIFVTGDNVIFDDNAKKLTVTLTDDLAAETVTVNSSKAYTFNGTGSLTGSTSLIKQGTGTLTIANDNTYTGPTVISGGTVKVSTLSNENKAYGNLGAVSAKNTNFIIENGATLQTTAAVQMGTPIRLNGDEGGVLFTDADFAMDKAFLGTLLTKKGNGTLICYQTNGSLNKLVLMAGSVAERNGNAAQTVELQGGTLWDDSQSTTHAIIVPKGKSATWQLTYSNYTAYSNKITGAGTLTIVPRNTVSRVRITGDWSQFEGTIKHTNASIWLPLDMGGGMPKGTLDIAEGCGVCNTAKTYTVGQLTGKGSLVQAGPTFINQSSVSGNNTWNVGNSDDKNFTFAGTFTDEGGNNKVIFNKIGTCKMTVTGKSNHSGATAVKAGELHFNTGALLGRGALSVAKDAVLSGATGTTALTNSSYSFSSGSTLHVGANATSTTGIIDFGGKSVTLSKGSTLHLGCTISGSKVNNTSLKNIATLSINATIQLYLSDNFIANAKVGDEITLWTDVTRVTGTPVLESQVIDAEKLLFWDTTDIANGILRVTSQAPDGIRQLSADGEGAQDIYTIDGRRVNETRPGQTYIINGRKVLVK